MKLDQNWDTLLTEFAAYKEKSESDATALHARPIRIEETQGILDSDSELNDKETVESSKANINFKSRRGLEPTTVPPTRGQLLFRGPTDNQSESWRTSSQ